jgi:thiol-disulfide isomerase/thioredoxin
MEVKLEKKVNMNTYILPNNLYLIACTAEWCGPCRRIKPMVNSLMKEIVNTEIISQSEFQEKINKYIPYFMVVSENKDPIENIQTSDKIEFINFIKKYEKIEIVDNF